MTSIYGVRFEMDENEVGRDEEETTARVAEIFRTLSRVLAANNATKVPFFEFVVNPESFGQTVENLFYLSFLVRFLLIDIH